MVLTKHSSPKGYCWARESRPTTDAHVLAHDATKVPRPYKVTAQRLTLRNPQHENTSVSNVWRRWKSMTLASWERAVLPSVSPSDKYHWKGRFKTTTQQVGQRDLRDPRDESPRPYPRTQRSNQAGGSQHENLGVAQSSQRGPRRRSRSSQQLAHRPQNGYLDSLFL